LHKRFVEMMLLPLFSDEVWESMVSLAQKGNRRSLKFFKSVIYSIVQKYSNKTISAITFFLFGLKFSGNLNSYYDHKIENFGNIWFHLELLKPHAKVFGRGGT
jgi:hypothetical protein